MKPADEMRFMAKVMPEPNTGCWFWTGGLKANGYGLFWLGKVTAAHRASYEHFIGPIPDGLQIDHLCSVKCCVNPDHLEPVTAVENIRRAARSGLLGVGNRKKTHCPRGHKYTPENTYTYTRKGGGPSRYCRACQRTKKRALYWKTKCGLRKGASDG